MAAAGGPQKKYSPEEVAAALAVVEACSGNVARASRQCGVPYRTLIRWAHEAPDDSTLPMTPERRRERIARAIPKAKRDLADKLERVAHGCVDAMTPKKMKSANLRELATSGAIAIDKMRLLRDEGPPPSEAELSAAESLKQCAAALVKLAEQAGQQITLEQAEQSIRETQLASARVM